MKVDLKRKLGTYTAPRGRFALVTLPPLQYLAIDGRGDPNVAPAYAAAIAAIYPMAYSLKFFSKRELGRDYVVMPLEALWWAKNMDDFTSRRDKSRWLWTLLNLVPDWITAEHLEAARRAGAGGSDNDPVGVRLELLDEGLCAQTLHIGSYDDEAQVLDRLHHEFVPSQGLRMTGKHHEIYLSDARRTPVEKLRTILRQPVERV